VGGRRERRFFAQAGDSTVTSGPEGSGEGTGDHERATVRYGGGGAGDPPRRGDGSRPGRRVQSIVSSTEIAMEAEQLNLIAHQLDDLADRAAELRRYL
jgi:hypothetical protein